MSFSLIVAFDKKRGISKNGIIPWKLLGDLSFFKEKTKDTIVIMGRKTWESLKFKPLPNRTCVVITSQDNYKCETNYIFNNLKSALKFFSNLNKPMFVIGGSRVYKEAIVMKGCNTIYTTEIYNDYGCDNFFPTLPTHFKIESVSNFMKEEDIYYRFFVYKKFSLLISYWSNKEENNYLSLLNNIVEYGEQRIDRTGIGTRSLFGQRLEYNITDTFPILTTRKQFFRGIFEELMMYLRGQTNNQILVDKGIHIWDKNTTREFLDNRGLQHLPEGDMGQTYGFNFRKFGGKYKTCLEDGEGGTDQLEHIINLLKTDPKSRRMIINLWDANNNNNAALPSCLCMYQFYTRGDYLDLMIYIRSSDYFLANNWNTCTGALFVNLLCNVKGINFKPGKIIVNMGDAHIYNTHLLKIEECRLRESKPFPKLVVKTCYDNITDFNYEDVCLIGYDPLPSVRVEMAV